MSSKNEKCLKYAGELCERIMTLTKLGIEDGQLKEMVVVLEGIDIYLEPYEEVFLPEKDQIESDHVKKPVNHTKK
jgi:hypothetical protein